MAVEPDLFLLHVAANGMLYNSSSEGRGRSVVADLVKTLSHSSHHKSLNHVHLDVR